MKAFVYRISDIKEPEVYRDILIQEDKNLEDFHFAILDAFDLNPGEMASFFTCDEEWNKGMELTLMDMGTMEHEAVNMLMQELTIGKAVEQSLNNFIFTYDFLFPKEFTVEFLEENTEIKEDVPVLLKVEGDYFGDAGLEDDEPTYKKDRDPDLEDMYSFDDDDDYDDDEPRFENIDDLDL